MLYKYTIFTVPYRTVLTEKRHKTPPEAMTDTYVEKLRAEHGNKPLTLDTFADAFPGTFKLLQKTDKAWLSQVSLSGEIATISVLIDKCLTFNLHSHRNLLYIAIKINGVGYLVADPLNAWPPAIPWSRYH